MIESGLYQLGKQRGTNETIMKIDNLKQRLKKDRPMTTISIRMPEDIIEDLKRLAPLLGFSGYQPLIRAYIGKGLREDMKRLETDSDFENFVNNLRAKGVSEEIISEALSGC